MDEVLERLRIEKPHLLPMLASGKFMLSPRYRVSRVSVLVGHKHRAVLFEGAVRGCIIVVHSELESPLTEIAGWIDLGPGTPWEWREDVRVLARALVPSLAALMTGMTVKDLCTAVLSTKSTTGKQMYDLNARRDFPVMTDVLAGGDNVFCVCGPRRW